MALVWALGVASVMSLQFLTQGWVWANWPVSDVMTAWLYILRDRVAVALAITMPVLAVGILPIASLRLRAGLLACAIVAGAVAGHAGLWLLTDRHGDLAGTAVNWSIIGMSIAGMFYLWRASVEARARLQAETLDDLRGQQQMTRAQLVALKNQIEPHFLFNTLATVRRLQRTEPAAGATMLANFIDYLRRAMPMLDSPQVPLSQEIALLRAYLAVIAVRMSGRLQVEIDVPADLDGQWVPPLVIATLVENAVKHGLTPAPDGGLLRVIARDLGQQVEIVVEDTGVGFGVSSTGGSGIGLANARARLQTLHGRDASLRLEANQPTGVRAIVTLPKSPAGDRS